MGFVSSSARKIAFWNYSRTSWQWDVLCVLILVFIFLTPKSWFETAAFRQNHPPQATVAVGVDVVGNQLDRAEIERRARQRSNRPEGQISDVRDVKDASGKVIAYEVDIR
jgi:hypothetical protein